MSILVTGGAGFVGTYFIPKLVSRGEKVVCFDIEPHPEKFSHLGDKVINVRGDSTRVEDILDAIKTYKVEQIVHFAVVIPRPGEAGLFYATRNSDLSHLCAYEAARLAGINRVLFGSSIAYFGPQSCYGERPLKEEDPGYPNRVYGGVQWFNEFMARIYNSTYGMNIVCARMAMTYGVGRRGGWIKEIVEYPVRGRPVKIPLRSSDKTPPLMHVDDLAEAVVRLCLAKTLKHQTYNTMGTSCTLKELGDTVKSFIPDAQISYDESSPPSDLIYLADNSRMREELGVVPRPLKEGIKEFIEQAKRQARLA